MKIITEILKRKQNGIDCTEAESAEIKMFVKECLGGYNTKYPRINTKISKLLPIEYAKALSESEINIGDKVDVCQTKDEFKENNFNVKGMIVVGKDGEYSWILKDKSWINNETVTMPKNYCKKVL